MAIFLFACLAFPFLGSYAWLKGRISMAKDSALIKVRRFVPSDEQVLWKFTPEEAETKLFWEHSREFEYKGQMYDIIRSEMIGDTIWYWCYWDKKESDVKRQLNDLASYFMGHGPDNRYTGRYITHFFENLFFTEIVRETKIPTAYASSRCLTPYDFSIVLHRSVPPAPPPWLS